MNDDQITALAHEYAEWVTDVPKAKELPNCLRNEANKLIADNAEHMLTWLCNRFCLVEKEAVDAKYQEAKERYFNPDDEIEKTVHGGRMSMLEYLFPGIAKEVGK